MSRQSHSKKNVTTLAFLLLIISIGFPFQSLVFDFELSLPTGFVVESNLLIVNLLLGNGYVGKSIFDIDTYYLQSESIIIPFANAVDQNNTHSTQIIDGYIFSATTYQSADEIDPINDVVVGRQASMETVQLSDRKFQTSTKPLWIQNNEGEYVERIIQNDVNGVMFESAKYSYYYDKSACALSVYDEGRISVGDSTIVKSNSWVAKFALNGTDNWTDFSQNSLSCVVTVIDNDSETKIISTRGDNFGIFTETYLIPKPLQRMETILTFFNNDTSINNHKIAFTNVLNEVPSNFRFSLDDQIIIPAGNYTAGVLNGTIGQYFDSVTLQMENYTIIDYTYPQEVVDTYKITQFTTNMGTLPREYDDSSVTFIDNEYNISFSDLHLQNGSQTGFTMDYWSERLQRTIPLKYDFINDSINKLWNIKIINDFRGNHIYIDYMNTEEIILVGETAILDPATSLGTVYTAVTTHAQVGTNGLTGCNNQPNDLAFDTNMRWEHHLSGSTFPNQNESNGCVMSLSQIDITSIPDGASVLQLDFGINATSVICTSSSSPSCTNSDQAVLFRWGMGNAEQILSLDGIQLGATILLPFDGVAENIAFIIPDNERVSFPASTQWALEPDGTGLFGCSTTSCRFEISSQVDPSTVTDLFETFLESGKDYVIWSSCHVRSSLGGSVLTGCGYGSQAGGNSPAFNIQNEIFYDESTFDLSIIWEIFELASAPQLFTCGSTQSGDLFLDWEIPLFDGGTPITGYQIQRSTTGGQSFIILEAGLPATPTEFLDTTVAQEITFTYRVLAINDLGIGAFAETSCGLASISGQVTDLTAQNVAVGIVALDWTPPVFTGNTEIVGYKIQRTTGTPSGITNDWTWAIHDNNGVQDPFGFTVLQNSENVVLNQPSGGTNSRGQTLFFKTFDKEAIDQRPLNVLQTFTENSSIIFNEIRLLDGSYSSDGINTVCGITCDFPFEQQILIKGNGILQTTGAFTAGFAETVKGFVIDTSNALLDEVTIFVIQNDAHGSTTSGASTSINSIEIGGFATWDFGDIVPTKSIRTVDSTFIVNPVGADQSGLVTVQLPNGIIISDGFLTLVNDTGNTNIEFIDSTVQETTLFGYRIFVHNTIGTSDPSNIVQVLTAGAPFPPEPITVTPLGTQTISIDWEEPNLNNGILVGYEIERKITVGGIFSTLTTVTGGATEFIDGVGLFTLQPATEHCYRVKTITVSESAFSLEQCATTFASPSVVQNLLVVALDGSSVNMQFDTPASDGGSPITGFKIEQKIGGAGFTILEALTFVQTRNDTGFPIGTEITYRVSASNQFGFGNTIQASDTTDATPQSPPNFSCSASSPSSITLNWDTPQTFTATTGYQIDRRTIGGAFSTIVADTASTATFFVNGGLPVDSTFQYRILGHTPEGDTDFTTTITCTTLGAPDFPPEDLQGDFTQTVPHQMVLAWDIPDTFGIPIISFRIERDDGAGYNEIASVSGSTFIFIDQNPDNDVNQKYRIFTVGTEGDSAPSIAIPFSANQVSHWHYERTVDDTGDNKNAGAITGTANFNNTGKIGLGHTFDGSTYITVADESDYDFDKDDSFGITTYFKGGGGNVTTITPDWHWAFMIHDAGASTSNAVTHDTTFTNLEQLAGGFTQGTTWFFKTFDKNEINGKDLKISWEGTGTIHRALVKMYDGEYLPSAGLSDFPSKAGCNGCAEFDPVIKDSGKLQFSTTKTGAFTLTTDTLFTIDTSGSTNSNDKVTIFVYYQDKESASVSTGRIGIDKIEIKNLGVWNFGTNAGATLLGNTPVTCTTFPPLNADSCGENNASTSFLPPSNQILVAKATTLTSTGFKLFIEETGLVGLKLTNTDGTNEISILGTTNVSDDVLHFIGVGYNGNGNSTGISLMVDGVFETKTVIIDNLSSSILNNEPLTIGASSDGTSILLGLLDETRFYGSGTLDDATLQAVAEDSITTVIPIVATITIAGSTFADISSETPLIIMTSGFPLPTISDINLFNFTATNVNSQTVGLVIDGVSGQFILDPSLFNVMSSLSNYTAISSLTNSEETFQLLSNFDIQVPIFTFTGDFFFQQQRNDDFTVLSFNYTQTDIPFDLACNFKTALFEDGETVEFNGVFFVQHLQTVEPLFDVVVACIDQNTIVVDPSAPSFGGINSILSFVSFGDTTGVGNFLQFTSNYGDFFGVGLPFLFVIILAAAFTGRSAPTGILIIAVAIGIMWAMGILDIDPFMWGIILVLVILGLLGGKKFL